jgi:hypothetical protein
MGGGSMTAFHPLYVSMYDHSFATLSAEAQVLEFYLRSAPNKSSEGLSRFSIGATEDDLGMPRTNVLKARQELEEARRPFWFDDAAGVVLDLTALRDNPLGRRRDAWELEPRGPRDKRIIGAISKLKSLPPTRLLRQLYVLAGKHSPEFAEAMREEFPDLEAPSQEEAPSSPFKPHEGARREETSSKEERRVGDDERALTDAEITETFNGQVVLTGPRPSKSEPLESQYAWPRAERRTARLRAFASTRERRNLRD